MNKIGKDKNLAIDKLDGDKKMIMDAYRVTRGNITTSCSVVGVGRSTFYYWLDPKSEGYDPVFAEAKADLDAELNDEIRDVLISKAAEADMTAVIFYLKSRHPDFKPQPLVQNNTQVNNFAKASENADRFVTEVKDNE